LLLIQGTGIEIRIIIFLQPDLQFSPLFSSFRHPLPPHIFATRPFFRHSIMFAQVRQSLVSSVVYLLIQSCCPQTKMSGHALSPTVDPDSNEWRKTGARDAPGGTYAVVTGAI
jgi:hypothetical protein